MKAYALLILLCTAAQFWSGSALAWSGCKYIVDLPAGVPQEVRDNALLQVSRLFDHAIPYHQITPADYEPALEIVLKAVQARMQLFKADRSTPTFENTIEALEFIWEPAGELLSFMHHLELLKETEEITEVLKKIDPILQAMERSIFLDANVFERVRVLYQDQAKLHLNDEKRALLQTIYQTFVEEGALLSEVDQELLSSLRNTLSKLEERYEKNIESIASKTVLEVRKLDEMRGLSEAVIQRAADLAETLGKSGKWSFLVEDEDYAQIIYLCENRALRERMWKAKRRAYTKGRYSNTKIVIQVAQLRHQIAGLLGHKSHTDRILAGRMAKTPETAMKFLNERADQVRPKAEEELRTLEKYAGFKLEPWDISFYETRLSTERFRVDDTLLLNYFSFDTVLKGAFQTAERLYGIRISARSDLPAWDDSVQTYAVTDIKTGEHIGLFYVDPYAREGKTRGTFMTTLRDGSFRAKSNRRPHVIQVHQFPVPKEGQLVFLPLEQVKGVFHEFGHILHGIFSKVSYPSIGGVNVPWDFIEFPSQMFELLATDPEVMQTYAKHHKTGKVIPYDRMMRMLKSQDGIQAMHKLHSLELAMIDLKLHSEEGANLRNAADLRDLEHRAGAHFRQFETYGSIQSTDLSHIIAGGYDAGYYGYAWDMELADRFYRYFKEQGVFNQKVAALFRKEVLEKGASEDPNELYRRLGPDSP